MGNFGRESQTDFHLNPQTSWKHRSMRIDLIGSDMVQDWYDSFPRTIDTVLRRTAASPENLLNSVPSLSAQRNIMACLPNALCICGRRKCVHIVTEY